jgi:hypothetical protein
LMVTHVPRLRRISGQPRFTHAYYTYSCLLYHTLYPKRVILDTCGTSCGYLRHLVSRITMLYGARYLKNARPSQNAIRPGHRGSCGDSQDCNGFTGIPFWKP